MQPSIADVSDAVAAILAAGGIGISPNYVAASYVKRGELVPLPQDYIGPRSTISALWPESRRASPNVKAFINFLSVIFPAETAWGAIVRAKYSASPSLLGPGAATHEPQGRTSQAPG